MSYQLVLQFRGDALRAFQKIDEPVGHVEAMLSDLGVMDGQDVGAHGANVFIFVENPSAAFERATELLAMNLVVGFAAAYRQVASEKFQVLWPAGQEFRLR